MAVAVPVILTLGVVTYAVSVLVMSAGGEAHAVPPRTVNRSAPPAEMKKAESSPGVPTPADAAGNRATIAAKRAAKATAEAPPPGPDGTAKQPATRQPSQLSTAAAATIVAAPQAPSLDLQRADQARAVQKRLVELGHFSGPATGVWGPLSKGALRSFKEANDLPPDTAWDAATETTLFQPKAAKAYPFVGRWAADLKACSLTGGKSGYLPTLIESNRAKAGETSCAFKDKRLVGTNWHVVADCATAKEKWTARIQLAVNGNRLTWTSERGSQQYRRCENVVETAGVGPR